MTEQQTTTLDKLSYQLEVTRPVWLPYNNTARDIVPEARPDIKVVFISGYAEDAFSDSQPQVTNAIFLPKPFSLTTLTQTVQEQLAETLPAA